MYYIALCDDNPYDLKILLDYLAELRRDHCPVETIALHDGNELVKLHEDGRKFDLIVLDMCMRPLNGIDTAARIRGYDDAVPILIVTGTEEFAVQGYTIHARRYLLKPVSREEFLSEVRQALQRAPHQAQGYFTFTSENGVTRVKTSEILYFESDVRTITLVCRQGRYSFTGKISEIARQMQARGFLRPHKSYVVNMDGIRNIFKESITLDNGIQIPLSKHKAREIHEKFLEYAEEKLCLSGF